MFPTYETFHLAGMNLTCLEGASGAPAMVILPNDPDSEKVLHDDETELWCN